MTQEQKLTILRGILETYASQHDELTDEQQSAADEAYRLFDRFAGQPDRKTNRKVHCVRELPGWLVTALAGLIFVFLMFAFWIANDDIPVWKQALVSGFFTIFARLVIGAGWRLIGVGGSNESAEQKAETMDSQSRMKMILLLAIAGVFGEPVQDESTDSEISGRQGDP